MNDKIGQLSAASRQRILDMLNAPSDPPKNFEVVSIEYVEPELSGEALRAADDVLALLALKDDIVIKPEDREGIARVFDDKLWNGNWDSSYELENFNILRLIQEDELDQHATDDMPKHEEQIGFVAGHYVFIE